MGPKFCPICRSEKVNEESFILPKSNRLQELAICDSCGHATVSKKVSLEKNLAVQRDQFNGNVILPDFRYARWPHRPALIAAEVRRLKGKGGKVLDIGCNTGLWLATLGKGWEKVGVELSSRAAEVARKFAQADVFCSPIESFDSQPNSFDLITAFAVIEHISDPKILVYWANDHLKRGGLLVLMTGDRESKTALQMGSAWPLYASNDHVSFFSARSLCHLVSDAGFVILRREWRFMYTPGGLGSRTLRIIMKIKEILRWVTEPQHDHFYLYAQKPF